MTSLNRTKDKQGATCIDFMHAASGASEAPSHDWVFQVTDKFVCF